MSEASKYTFQVSIYFSCGIIMVINNIIFKYAIYLIKLVIKKAWIYISFFVVIFEWYLGPQEIGVHYQLQWVIQLQQGQYPLLGVASAIICG